VSEYRATPISVHITRIEQHPVFGEGVLLTLDDEGGGAFLVIKDTSDLDTGKVRLELGELEQLVIEARKLVHGRQAVPATTDAICAAITVAQPLIVTSWVELATYIDRNQLNGERGALIRTADLMQLWCVTQPTVSRRLAAIRRAGLAKIEQACGIRGGWWVKQ
jgi:hypothetical protein